MNKNQSDQIMKIAIVNSEYPNSTGSGQGGISTYTFEIASALVKKGHQVHVLARKGMKLDQFIYKNIKIHNFDFEHPDYLSRILNRIYPDKIYWEKGQSKSLKRKLLEIFESDGLDIVEIPEYGGMANQCASGLPFPIVINFHTPTEIVDELNNHPATNSRRKLQKFERKALCRASAYRCPSEALRKIVCERFSIPSSKIRIIRNPLFTGPFENIEPVHKSDRIDILFTGRLEYRKGAEVILKSIKNILSLKPDIHITFAGETELGEATGYRMAIERVLDSEERKRVWFLGPISSSQLPLLYKRSDIFILPSLFENYPYSLIEAMAACLPIVASNTGGITELIQHDKNGLLFPPGNPDELVSQIKVFIDNPSTALKLAEQAGYDVRTECSPEDIAEQSVDFYKTVIDNENPLHIK
jgi:glycogen(starch) synthase